MIIGFRADLAPQRAYLISANSIINELSGAKYIER